MGKKPAGASKNAALLSVVVRTISFRPDQLQTWRGGGSATPDGWRSNTHRLRNISSKWPGKEKDKLGITTEVLSIHCFLCKSKFGFMKKRGGPTSFDPQDPVLWLTNIHVSRMLLY